MAHHVEAMTLGHRVAVKESRVRHGAPLELSVDTRYLQFFDPDSGLSIGHPQATEALAE
jgi:hypothetical protein